MAWREIKSGDVLGHVTPAEAATLQKIVNGTDTLSPKVDECCRAIRGYIRAGANQEDATSPVTIPDQLRVKALDYILAQWLNSYPALKLYKTADRMQAGKDAEKYFDLVASQDKDRPRIELPPNPILTADGTVTMPVTGHTKLHEFRRRKEDGII